MFFCYSVDKYLLQKYNKCEKYNLLYEKEFDMEKNKSDKDKFVGICKVGEKGQIVIPKEIRTMFDINPGDSVIVLCDKEKGIALLKADVIDSLTDKVLKR